MVVISDTTCLSTLARIGELSILSQLFHEILIPRKVFDELQALDEFEFDTSIFSTAKWLLIKDPQPTPLLNDLLSNRRIDAGEAYAIALAIEVNADWLILDDWNARLVATALHLNITGLGGILIQAKNSGFVSSIKPLLDLCIEKANFRLSQEVYQKILQLADE